jgi:hypothetical protein
VHSSEALLSVLEKPQKGLKVKGAKMLAADVPTEEDILGIKAHRARIEGNQSNSKGLHGAPPASAK